MIIYELVKNRAQQNLKQMYIIYIYILYIYIIFLGFCWSFSILSSVSHLRAGAPMHLHR